MARDVSEAFEQFARNLRATPAETAAAASHRASVEAKLKQSFGMTAFFRSGSFGNGTNVTGYSDVDYFAVIPTSNLKTNSAITLSEVANALRERFPTTPNIRVNSPGVQVPFGFDGSEYTEIIPVDATGTTLLGFRQFDMPDGNGGWKFSAPESHKAFVDEENNRLGGNLKPLIRCIKAWNFYRNAGIRSFYLEMFVTAQMQKEPAIVYSIDIPNVLEALASHGIHAITDPRFTKMTTLPGCSSEAKRLEALGKVNNAATWARQARSAELAGRLAEAFQRWDLVFDYRFPTLTD